jgi:histone deacetylase 11
MVYNKFIKLISLCLISLWCLHSEAKFLKEIKRKHRIESIQPKLPIVFSKNYDVGFFGLEKLHPFDSKKYGKVRNYLVNIVGIQSNQFYVPERITRDNLLIVHTEHYLESLKSSEVVARIAENPALAYLPNFIVRKNLLEPMQDATGGTVLAVDLAMNSTNGPKWAINLAGGYHHCKGKGRNISKEKSGNSDEGGGFCIYADIQLAIEKLWQKKPNAKVLIVDLDAHQGNGHEAYFKDNNRIAILDIYNYEIYPHDYKVIGKNVFNYPVKSYIDDAAYLHILKTALPDAIAKFKPDLIFYNAGTDVYEKDPLGCMSISDQGIIKRDAFVFEQGMISAIPIVMVLSGGYTQESASIIGKSIENILKNVLKVI